MNRFMRKKNEKICGVSQPEYVISMMNRGKDWAVPVCLIVVKRSITTRFIAQSLLESVWHLIVVKRSITTR